MPTKITQKEFEDRVAARRPGHKVLGTYVDTTTKVEIECSVEGHGSFFIRPDSFINRGSGCKKCSRSSQETIIARAVAVHGNKYDYSKTVYSKMINRHTIICPDHGEFVLTMVRHILDRTGCSKCAAEERRQVAQGLFEARVKALNPDYKVLGTYVGSAGRIDISCPKHGSFTTTGDRIKAGLLCNECNKEVRLAKQLKESRLSFKTRVEALGTKYTLMGEFNGGKTPVGMHCPEHGDFTIYPNNLLNGGGCLACSLRDSGQMRSDKVKEGFLDRIKAFGKSYKVIGEYTGHTEEIELECPDHGRFVLRASHMLRGHGCHKCGGVYRYTHAEFVERVDALGKQYKVLGEYKNAVTKLDIECHKHGAWSIKPANLLSGFGCPSCGRETIAAKLTQECKDNFVARVKSYGQGYTVLGDYVNSHTPVKLSCPVHGSFMMTPASLYSGHGCIRCSGIYSPTHKEFVALVKASGSRYKVVSKYVNNKTRIEFLCPDHGVFLLSPDNFKRGRGCPSCAEYGFNPSKPAILYYIEVEGKYKIGVSNNTVFERYPLKSDQQKIRIIQVIQYDNGQEALDAENLIKQTFKDALYKGAPPLRGVGISEFFTYDVLSKDVEAA